MSDDSFTNSDANAHTGVGSPPTTGPASNAFGGSTAATRPFPTAPTLDAVKSWENRQLVRALGIKPFGDNPPPTVLTPNMLALTPQLADKYPNIYNPTLFAKSMDTYGPRWGMDRATVLKTASSPAGGENQDNAAAAPLTGQERATTGSPEGSSTKKSLVKDIAELAYAHGLEQYPLAALALRSLSRGTTKNILNRLAIPSAIAGVHDLLQRSVADPPSGAQQTPSIIVNDKSEEEYVPITTWNHDRHSAQLGIASGLLSVYLTRAAGIKYSSLLGASIANLVDYGSRHYLGGYLIPKANYFYEKDKEIAKDMAEPPL